MEYENGNGKLKWKMENGNGKIIKKRSFITSTKKSNFGSHPSLKQQASSTFILIFQVVHPPKCWSSMWTAPNASPLIPIIMFHVECTLHTTMYPSFNRFNKIILWYFITTSTKCIPLLLSQLMWCSLYSIHKMLLDRLLIFHPLDSSIRPFVLLLVSTSANPF